MVCHFAKLLFLMKFHSTLANPDVKFHMVTHHNSKSYYKMIVVNVDNMIVIIYKTKLATTQLPLHIYPTTIKINNIKNIGIKDANFW
jgi:hypothetical protein